MNILSAILEQLVASLQQMVGGITNGSQTALSLQDTVLNSDFLFVVKLISGALIIGLVIALIVILKKHGDATRQLAAAQNIAPSEPATAGPVQNRWDEVMKHVDSVHEGEWKFAVIEADKLVDDQLKLHFSGETMGERLMNIDKTKLLSIDGLWEAHKVRNRLSHDVGYFLRHAEAVRTIRLFQATLEELGAINPRSP